MLKKAILLLASILLPILVFSQHVIKGNFSPRKDFNKALLYKITPTSTEYIAYSNFDDNGNFEIKLNKSVTEGMYRLVYAQPQDECNFDIIYNAKEDIELNFTHKKGVHFINSKENNLMHSYTNAMTLVSQDIGKLYGQTPKDSLAIIQTFKTQQQLQETYQKKANGTLAAHFINASNPYTPTHFEDVNTYIKNIEAHFFDHIDFNNVLLQSSDFLIERMFNYIYSFGNSSQQVIDLPYKKHIDLVYEQMQNSSITVKKNLLELLWLQMLDQAYDSTANYISDTYLLDIAKTLKDDALITRLEISKRLSLGNVAPDFSFEISENGKKHTKKLSELEATKNYILVFWSSTCGHCLEEIPKLQQFLKTTNKSNFQVLAFGLEHEKGNWEKEIKKYPEFIHIYGKDKWRNEVARLYNITGTPSYFILDKDKKITAKPYDLEAIEAVLGH